MPFVRARLGLASFALVLLVACPEFDRTAQPNNLPVVEAGDDQLRLGGEQVSLSGTGTDADGDPLSFRWTQIGGAPVELSDPDNPQVTFVAPQVTQTLVFSLTAHDGFDDSPADLVRVDVRFNRPPIADPGEAREVRNLTPLTLTGAGSDPDDDPIRGYRWAVEAGPPGSDLSARLSGAETRNPVFTPDRRGQYTLSLVVSDGGLESDPDFVVINSRNNAPVADAGEAKEIRNGESLLLSGSASDVDGDSLFAFQWTIVRFPPGADFSIFNARTATATFVPRTRGTYVLELLANDGEDTSVPSELIVSSLNNPPVADAGPNLWSPNTFEVTMSGAGADTDGDDLSYRWTIVSRPMGSNYTIADTGLANARFTPLNRGVYVLALEVSDGADTSTDTVTVNATNNAPTADAGGRVEDVTTGQVVTLNGLASADPDGDALTFQWAQLSGQNVVFDPASPTPSFTAPGVLGTLLFELVVTDGSDPSPATTVEVVVNNLPPVAAVANPLLPGDAGTMVALDGSPSSDPNGDPIVSYEWTQVDGPTVTLNNSGSSMPSFTAPAFDPDQGDLIVFQLRVSDGRAFSAPVLVSVRLVPDESSFVFVAPPPLGDPGNAGTRAAPLPTLSIAAFEAAMSGRSIALAGGAYDEGADLPGGMSVFGGYDPTTWLRDPDQNPTVVAPFSAPGLRITATNAGPTFIDGLTARTPENGSEMVPIPFGPMLQVSAAILCQGCRDLTIRDVRAEGTTGFDTMVVEIPVAIVNATGDVVVEDSVIQSSVSGLKPRAGLLASGGSVLLTVRRNRFDIWQETDAPFFNGGLVLGPLNGATIDGNDIEVVDAVTCVGGTPLFGIQTTDVQGSRFVNNVLQMKNAFCPDSFGMDILGSSNGTVVANNVIRGSPRQPVSAKTGLRIELPAGDTALVANNFFYDLNYGYRERGLGSNDPSYPLVRANAFEQVDDFYDDTVVGFTSDLAVINTLDTQSPSDPPNGGNISVDCEVEFATGRYELAPTSPCIDRGDRVTGVPDHDFNGASRPIDWSGVSNYADGTDIGVSEVSE